MKSPRVLVFLALLFTAVMAIRAADTRPPFVSVRSPSADAALSGLVAVSATATGNVAVASVTLKVDGASICAPLTNPPFTFSLDTRTLANGVHSLLAVATDTSGNSARSAVVSVTVSNPTSYRLAAGPFSIEDLGPVLSANTQEKQIMFRLPNNDLHLLLYYDVTAIWRYPLQILDVNLSRGTARLTDGILGRPGYGTVLYPNDKVYIGSGDPGYLLEYDPSTGVTNFIGKLHPTLRRDTQVMEVGDDGWIYVGEYSPLGGGLARYNPANSVFEDLGLMDTNFNAPQYAYTIGADTRYVYVGLGQQPWYLAIHDTQTTATTLYWKNERDTGGEVYHGKNGRWYYKRGTTNGNKYYLLRSGVPTRIARLPAVYQWFERGNVVSDPANFPSHFGVEINLDDACPDSSRDKAFVAWRQVGATNWKSVEMSGFRLQPVNIKRLYPWNGSQLFGFADFYGPVFLFDTATGATTKLGRPQFSLYDGLFVKGNVYLSGYPAVTLKYDPSKAWTLSGSTTNKSNPAINPHQIPARFGKYSYYSAFGADGFVYVGAQHERDSTGGELGWYDPVTGKSGSLRAPFLTDDVRDLKPALGATKLVYSSNNEKLFVFDVAAKRIERTITPIPGIGPLDKITEVAPGIIFGATSNRIFEVDIRSGSILYTNTIPGAAFGGSAIRPYDRRLTLGPDGYVWMFIDKAIYRINPTDGSMTNLVSATPSNLMFNGGDLYLYGGTNLGRIQRVLIPVGPTQPQALRVVPPVGG